MAISIYDTVCLLAQENLKFLIEDFVSLHIAPVLPAMLSGHCACLSAHQTGLMITQRCLLSKAQCASRC